MNIVFLGLGTNLGDRTGNLNTALKLLPEKGLKILAVSGIYETAAWGFTDQPDFLNLCLQARTDLNPGDLLDTLKILEKEIGRKESFHWGPRLIDIDILYYNNQIISEDNIRIPHPGIAQRDFVLAPLTEIAPDFINPLNHLSSSQMLENLPANSARVFSPAKQNENPLAR